MEDDILQFLKLSSCSTQIKDLDSLHESIAGGISDEHYTSVVVWLCNQLISFHSLECGMHYVPNKDETANFLTELSGFLRELGCPHAVLTDGPLQNRLDSYQKCLLLLHFLCGELQSAQFNAVNNLKNAAAGDTQKAQDVIESDLAKYLRLISKIFGLGRPPADLTSEKLFKRLSMKTRDAVNAAPTGHIGTSLLNASLTDKQWSVVERVNEALSTEYKTRRETLLKRLDVTIQSFLWSDKGKKIESQTSKVLTPMRRNMKAVSNVTMAHVLAARNLLLLVEKIDSGEARKRSACAVNKVLMGDVPDRGGRAWEFEPPPPEMPAFRKREAQPQRSHSGARGGRGRGGGGGGRGQHPHSAATFQPQGAGAMFGQANMQFTAQYDSSGYDQGYGDHGQGYGGGGKRGRVKSGRRY